MGKYMFIFLWLTLAAVATHAQHTPATDARQRGQQARIREGARSGDLTRSETRRLRSEQQHIRRTERRMKSDGEITRKERARLQRKQYRASRDIRRQKHDGQSRPQ